MNKHTEPTIAWYDANAAAYARRVRPMMPLAQMARFESFLPTGATHILDAGCGAGRDAGEFAERGYVTTGIDLSVGLLEIAKISYPGVTFLHADMRQPPFAPQSFDGVWSCAALLHMPTMTAAQEAVNAWYAVSRPGGALFITVTSDKSVPTDDERHFLYFTQNELGTIVESAGYTIQEMVEEKDGFERPNTFWINLIAVKHA